MQKPQTFNHSDERINISAVKLYCQCPPLIKMFLHNLWFFCILLSMEEKHSKWIRNYCTWRAYQLDCSRVNTNEQSDVVCFFFLIYLYAYHLPAFPYTVTQCNTYSPTSGWEREPWHCPAPNLKHQWGLFGIFHTDGVWPSIVIPTILS